MASRQRAATAAASSREEIQAASAGNGGSSGRSGSSAATVNLMPVSGFICPNCLNQVRLESEKLLLEHWQAFHDDNATPSAAALGSSGGGSSHSVASAGSTKIATHHERHSVSLSVGRKGKKTGALRCAACDAGCSRAPVACCLFLPPA